MHIAAMVISIICGIMNIFMGGIGMLFGGVGYGVAEFFGEDSGEMSTLTGVGAICLIAAILGIIGGIFAALKKKPGWVILAITTVLSLITALAVQGGFDSGFNDAYIYTFAYGLATFLAYKSSKAIPVTATVASTPVSTATDVSQPSVYSKSVDLEGNPSKSAKGWVCMSCGKENAIDWKFCSACGKARDVVGRHCSACGEKVPEAARFCPACGTPFSATISSAAEDVPTQQVVVKTPEPEGEKVEVIPPRKGIFTLKKILIILVALVVAIAIIVLSSPPLQESIFGGVLFSPEAPQRVEPFEMPAIWVSNPTMPKDAIYEEGGILLQLKSMGDNKIDFVLTTISAPPSNRVAEVESTAKIYKWQGDSFEASFSYNDDNWGNAGKGKLLYDGKQKSLVLEVKETKSNSDSMWAIGTFKERLYSSF
jgi:hypothetical protein